MALPITLRTPTPPPPLRKKIDEYTGLEHLDRPELDEAPDTDPCPTPSHANECALEWDEDSESGVKRRA